MSNVAGFLQRRELGVASGRRKRKAESDIFLEEQAANPVNNTPCSFMSGHCRSTFLMEFSPDGTKVASTHGDHTVRVTDLNTGHCVRTLQGHPRTPWCLAFHPSSNHILASGCLGGEVRIWDLYGLGCEVWQPKNSMVIASMTFHPTDHVLVFAAGSAIYFWDWSKPEPFACCQTSHEYERIRWVKFDHLGHFLFTGIANNTAATREEAATITVMGQDSSTSSRNASRPPNPPPRRLARDYYNLMHCFEDYRRDRAQNQSAAGAGLGPSSVGAAAGPSGIPDRMSSETGAPEGNGDSYPDGRSASVSSPVHVENLDYARQYASHVTMTTAPRIRRAQNYAAGVTRQFAQGGRLDAARRRYGYVRELRQRGVWSPPPHVATEEDSEFQEVQVVNNEVANADTTSGSSELSIPRLDGSGAIPGNDRSNMAHSGRHDTEDNGQEAASEHVISFVVTGCQNCGNITSVSFPTSTSITSTTSNSQARIGNIVCQNRAATSVTESSEHSSISNPASSTTTSEARHRVPLAAQQVYAQVLQRTPLEPNDTSLLENRTGMMAVSGQFNSGTQLADASSPPRSNGNCIVSTTSCPSSPLLTHCLQSKPSASSAVNMSASVVSTSASSSCRNATSGIGAKSSKFLSIRDRLQIDTSNTVSAPPNSQNLTSGPVRIISVEEQLSTTSSSLTASGASTPLDGASVVTSVNETTPTTVTGSSGHLSSTSGLSACAVTAGRGPIQLPCSEAVMLRSRSSQGLTGLFRNLPSSRTVTQSSSTLHVTTQVAPSSALSSIQANYGVNNGAGRLLDQTLASERHMPQRTVDLSRSRYHPYPRNRNDSDTTSLSASSLNSMVSAVSSRSTVHVDSPFPWITRRAENTPQLSQSRLSMTSFNPVYRSSAFFTPISISESVSDTSSNDSQHSGSNVAANSDTDLFNSGSNVAANSDTDLFNSDSQESQDNWSVQSTNSSSRSSIASVSESVFNNEWERPMDGNLNSRNLTSEASTNDQVLTLTSDNNNNTTGVTSDNNNNDTTVGLTNSRPVVQDYEALRDNFVSMTDRIEREMVELNRRITALRESFNQSLRALRQDRERFANIEREFGVDMPHTRERGVHSNPTSAAPPVITITRLNEAEAAQYRGEAPGASEQASGLAQPRTLLESSLRTHNRRRLIHRPDNGNQIIRVSIPDEDEPSLEPHHWRMLQRRYLHPHYSSSILDDTINRPSDAIQAAINRAIAGAFMGTGEPAVANNIINQTHRIQCWDFTKCHIPDLTDASSNIIVPNCKLHNDASCDISSDGTLLATYVPSHRGFPDDNILAVFSLCPESLGQCLFTKSFGPNAISVSISPKNHYILVGLAAKRLSWVFTANQLVAQIYKLESAHAGERSMKHVKDVCHPCSMDIRTHVSVNSAKWLPGVGQGLVYGTNRGDLHICKSGVKMCVEKEHSSKESGTGSAADGLSTRRNLSRELSDLTASLRRTISTATQTFTRGIRRTAGTQTEESD